MKKAYTILALILLSTLLSCGERDRYARPARDGERVFYGDSITEMCAPRLNRGYGGYKSADILPTVRYYAERDGEAEYFILIGINDISSNDDERYMYNMNEILGDIGSQNVTIISILPTLDISLNERVRYHNEELKVIANHFGVKYRDAYSEIRPEHFLDKVHLNREGCRVLYENE